jgi:hypothetical protein
MNRSAGIVALIAVVALLAHTGTSFTGTSFAFAAVLVGAGVLAYRFVQACVAAEGPQIGNWREFVARVFQVTFRVAIGTLALVWMVVGLFWAVDRFGG